MKERNTQIILNQNEEIKTEIDQIGVKNSSVNKKRYLFQK